MVKIIKSPTPIGFAHFPGEIAEYSKEIEDKMVSEGYAIPHIEEEPAEASTVETGTTETGKESKPTEEGKDNRKDKTEKEVR